jgi:membrane protease subunit HflK
MPWNNNGGPGGNQGGGQGPWGPPPGGSSGGGSSGGGGGDGRRPGGPWGQGPGGSGPRGPGQTPPDLDQLIAQAQAFIRRLLPGGVQGPGGGRGMMLAGIGIVALWLASGFYRVQPDEVGVELRFGAFHGQTFPGLNYHLPWPVEEVLKPPVTRINRTEVGYRSTGGDLRIQQGSRDVTGRDVLEESLMLTGDENIIDIDFAVFWRIRTASDYLFNTRAPAGIVKAVAESAMREVIGRTPIQPALTELRAKIEQEVMKETQEILDQYKAGVEITQVQLQKVDPPHAVIDSFRDVQRANTDAETKRNEAEAYHNDIVPRARGEAARITAEADGFRQSTIAEANGQAQRFTSVLKAYQDAKDLTLQRMYIETMQEVLSHTQTVVVDDNVRGLVPLLSLGDAAATNMDRAASPSMSPLQPAQPRPAQRRGGKQ